MSLPMPENPLRARLVLRWVLLYLATCAVCGLLAGLFWVGVVRPPTYEVRTDGRAVVGERGLSAFFSADAWFVVTGLVVGLMLGFLAWRWFRPLGWATSVIGAVGAVVAALCCWGLGTLVGPGPLAERLATAQPGDRVPIALELSAHSAIAAWPFAAMVPLLLLSSLLPDPEDPRPPREPRRKERPQQPSRAARA